MIDDLHRQAELVAERGAIDALAAPLVVCSDESQDLCGDQAIDRLVVAMPSFFGFKQAQVLNGVGDLGAAQHHPPRDVDPQ